MRTDCTALLHVVEFNSEGSLESAAAQAPELQLPQQNVCVWKTFLRREGPVGRQASRAPKSEAGEKVSAAGLQGKGSR